MYSDGMQPKLDIRHLALLDALGQVGGLGAAAELLGVTQSALSHRLREAERRLGTPLCRRSGRALLLTPAGERLRLSAGRLIGDLLRAEADVQHMTDLGIRQVARIGQTPYASLHWFPAFYAWCRERLPDLQVEVAGEVGESGLSRLLDGALDLVLLAGMPRHPGLRLVPLSLDSLVAVAAPGHPWEAMKTVPPQALRRETFLSYGYDVDPDLEYQRFMRPAGCFPAKVVKVGRPDAVLELIAAGQGISILAAWPIRPWLARGAVIARPLAPLGATAPGLPLAWQAAVRESDGSKGPGPRLADALAAWAGASGAFGGAQVATG